MSTAVELRIVQKIAEENPHLFQRDVERTRRPQHADGAEHGGTLCKDAGCYRERDQR